MMTWARFYGGPQHGQVSKVPADDAGRPVAYLNVLLPTATDIVGITPPVNYIPGGDTYRWTLDRRGGRRYEWVGPDRSDWGDGIDLRDVQYHVRGHRDQLDRLPPTWEGREEWIWVFPTNKGPTLTVVERIQVIHADVPYPILGRRPEYTIGAAL